MPLPCMYERTQKQRSQKVGDVTLRLALRVVRLCGVCVVRVVRVLSFNVHYTRAGGVD